MCDHEHEREDQGPDRRDFFHQTAALGGAALLAADLLASDETLAPLEMSNVGPDKVPRKPFGKTKEKVSIIGIGGATLGRASSLGEATRIVHEAIDAGVNFMDNAWEYNDGRS